MVRQIAVILCIICALFSANMAFAENASPGNSGMATEDPAIPAVHDHGPSQAVQPGQEEVMTDIVDIKPLEKIGYDKRVIRYILITLAALVLIALIIFLVDYYLKKRRKKEEEAAAPDPADIVALRMLNSLEGEPNPDAREFYFRLSAIMRQYIGGRYSIDALEMTNEELIPALLAIDLEKDLKNGVKDLLITSAPVKFAGMPADSHTMKNHLGFVRDLVLKTKPAEDPGDGS